MELSVEEFIKSNLAPEEYLILYAVIQDDKSLLEYLKKKGCFHEYHFMNLELEGYIKLTKPVENKITWILRQKALSLQSQISEVDFKEFWDEYHIITKQRKSDLQASIKYWKKLTNEEKESALGNIQNYYDSLPFYTTGRPVKKARTYLADKNFNDEFEIKKEKKRSRNKMI